MQHAISRARRWVVRAASVAAPVVLMGAAATGIPVQGFVVAPGWFALEAPAAEYRAATEPLRRPGGQGFVGLTIVGQSEFATRSGIVQQTIRADRYRGQRVRLSGWVRMSADTASMAQGSLWMRVDGKAGPLTSDYMTDRLITGTRDWAPYTVVLDVPRDATGITFGMLLSGRGQLWLDDVKFETAGKDVAITGRPGHALYPGGIQGCLKDDQFAELCASNARMLEGAPTQPLNLDFEQVLVSSRE